MTRGWRAMHWSAGGAVGVRDAVHRRPSAPRADSMTGDWRFLAHNLVLHPLAGLAWFVGLSALGDRLHAIGDPEES